MEDEDEDADADAEAEAEAEADAEEAEEELAAAAEEQAADDEAPASAMASGGSAGTLPALPPFELLGRLPPSVFGPGSFDRSFGAASRDLGWARPERVARFEGRSDGTFSLFSPLEPFEPFEEQRFRGMRVVTPSVGTTKALICA